MSWRDTVVGAGAIIATWGGRSGFAAFLVSGGTYLWPPPPALSHELQAVFLGLVAMAFLSLGEFVAAYLAMLATTTATPSGPGPDQLAKVQQIQRALFDLLAELPETLKKIFKATVGLFRND